MDEVKNIRSFEVRTDLALENRENLPERGRKIQGVSMKEWFKKKSGIRFSEVRILDHTGEEALGKPKGTYITMEADRLSIKDESFHEEVSEGIAGELKHMVEEISARSHTQIGKNFSILAVGLGNSLVTPDSLGPRVLENLIMTRHLKNRMGMPAISGIIPGVMAQTGMETREIIEGIVRETRPDLVIAVDALAARSICRLGTTIQLTDTGIRPGSGVGNYRESLTVESLGIPVFAIGVPTVVSAAAIVKDTFSALIKLMRESKAADAMCSILEKSGEDEQYALICSALEPEFGTLYVTPPDIDETVKMLSYTISEGIHRAFSHML